MDRSRENAEKEVYRTTADAYSTWEAYMKSIIGMIEGAGNKITDVMLKHGQGYYKRVGVRELLCDHFEEWAKQVEDRWDTLGEMIDSMARMRSFMMRLPDEFPQWMLVQKTMESEAKMETAEETKERIGRTIRSVRSILDMATDFERRGQVFDCPEELRRVVDELKKELGWEWRTIYKQKIFTIPVIMNAYLRNAKEESTRPVV